MKRGKAFLPKAMGAIQNSGFYLVSCDDVEKDMDLYVVDMQTMYI